MGRKQVTEVTVKFDNGQTVTFNKNVVGESNFPIALFWDDLTVKKMLAPYYTITARAQKDSTITIGRTMTFAELKARFGEERANLVLDGEPQKTLTACDIEKLWDAPNLNIEPIGLMVKLPECDVRSEDDPGGG